MIYEELNPLSRRELVDVMGVEKPLTLPKAFAETKHMEKPEAMMYSVDVSKEGSFLTRSQ